MKLIEPRKLVNDPRQRGNTIQSRPCADMPSGLKDTAGKDSVACPVFAGQPAAQGDQVRFKGKVNHAKPCCVNRIKAGKSLGCCGDQTQEEFHENFKNSIQRTIDKECVEPKLAEGVEEKLYGDKTKSSPQNVSSVRPTEDCCEVKKELSAAEQARLKEPALKRLALAPFRWFKWLMVGLWEDLRLLFRGNEK